MLGSLVSRARPGRRHGVAARAGTGLLVASVVLVACGDDDDGADVADAANVTLGSDVQGCEVGDASAGPGPDEAPPMPDDPVAALDDAIDATRAMSSAVVTQTSVVDAPDLRSSVEIATSIDDRGVGRVASRQAAGNDEATIVTCSDGDTAWLHVDHPTTVGKLPEGVSWAEGTRQEFLEAGLIVDLAQTWDALPALRGLQDAEDQGTTEVNSVPVRVLRGPVDYSVALDAASDEEAASLSRAIVAATEDVEVEARVGLDGDGVVRLLEIELRSAAIGDAPAVDEQAGDVSDPADVAGGAAEGDLAITFRLEVEATDPAMGAPAPPSGDMTVPLSEVPSLMTTLDVG